MRHILRCPKCKKYTMKETCEKCSLPTETIRPPKYSPEDKYAEYRRKYKYELENNSKA